MNLPGSFNARPTGRRRLTRHPYQFEKLIGERWQCVSLWPAVDDAERLRKHASAFGGHTRLLRGDMLMRQWICGQERDVEEQLECA